MVSHLRRLMAPLAALAVTAMVVVIPMPSASAAGEPDPVEQLLNSLQSDPATEAAPSDDASAPGAKLATKSSPPPAPSSDDDTVGHETAEPVAPDHGRAEIADLDVDGNDVADVGHNNATVQDDDSTTADSTILALGGQEIAGAHADSNGTQHDSFEPLAPLTDEVCDGSGDKVCLEVLYAHADATDDGTTSSSSSQNGVTNVCLREEAGQTGCTVEAGVSNSEGEAQRNQRTGRTTASSESSLADACVQRGPTGCAVGVDLVRSEGQSDSGSSPGSASRDSYVVAGDLGGQEVGRVEDAQTISLPADCPAAKLLCIFLNQGETYVGDGIAGHAQEAVGVSVLPDNVVNVELGRTDSLVHNDGGEAAPPTGADPGAGAGSDVAGVGSGGPGAPGGGGGDVLGAAAGVLPNAGGVWSGLLAIALFAIGAGAFFVAYSRRQVVA